MQILQDCNLRIATSNRIGRGIIFCRIDFEVVEDRKQSQHVGDIYTKPLEKSVFFNPCFIFKPVHHGHNLRSCKTNPAHFRIPVSRTVRHKQSLLPRGAKLNLI